MSQKPHVPCGTIATLATGWRETVLICGKCSKKLDGGFGPDGSDSLRSAVRAVLRHRGQRGTVQIIETGCFGLCPKKAVVAARGSRPGELTILGKGADPAALLDAS